MAAGVGIASAAFSMYSASRQAQAIKLQTEFAVKQNEFNAAIADIQANQAIKRGDESAQRYLASAKQVIGKQRAGFGAQGIEIDSGSAIEIQNDTASIATTDAATIRNNAFLEAWGYKSQSAQYSAAGRFASASGNFNSRMTLVNGGMRALTAGVGGFAAGGGGGGNQLPNSSSYTDNNFSMPDFGQRGQSGGNLGRLSLMGGQY